MSKWRYELENRYHGFYGIYAETHGVLLATVYSEVVAERIVKDHNTPIEARKKDTEVKYKGQPI